MEELGSETESEKDGHKHRKKKKGKGKRKKRVTKAPSISSSSSSSSSDDDDTQRKGIECALWPNLYPYSDWCDSTLDGKETRLSSKVSYMIKVNSEIADYGINHELLHFHYDLWLWQTVSGAIASARRMKCNPNKALEAKTFSTEYWR